jgi:MFS transporter, CP family, cyanate transporter
MPNHSRAAVGAPTAVLTALVLVSLALRPQLGGIGPLSGRIIDDLGVSHAFVGLLTTIPILCMGLFAPIGPVLGAKAGARGSIALASGAVALAGLARAIVPGELAILALTLVIGITTATSGPLLAMFVRGRLHEHRVAGTAAYAGGTTLGSALAAGAVVPLAVGLGGWRVSMGAVSAASLVGALAWIVLVPRGGRPGSNAAAVEEADPDEALDAGGADEKAEAVAPVASGRLSLPVRRPVVWALGLLFGIQSAVFYGINAWLPSLYVERGWEPASAAALLSLSSFAGLASILVAPIASRRGVERRQLLVTAATAIAVGIGGVVALPALGWVWSVVIGAGLGLMFTVVLTLPTDVAADAQEAGGASALMLLVGYLIASSAPFALGAVRDATGSFAVSLWLLLALAASMVPLSWVMSPTRLRPRVVARREGIAS